MSLAQTKDLISAAERHGREKYKQYAPYRVTVPEGKAGPWKVAKFTTEYNLAYMRFAVAGRPPGLGEFTMLAHKKRGVVMSDTCAEVDDLRLFMDKLVGHVLISGLGLGMVAHLLTKHPRWSPGVKSITILEKEADVIMLTGDHYCKSDPRITIHHADTLSWTPPKGATYDAAWHDIWDMITVENKPEMSAIRRRYKRYVSKGQQYCWGQYEVERMARAEARSNFSYA